MVSIQSYAGGIGYEVRLSKNASGCLVANVETLGSFGFSPLVFDASDVTTNIIRKEVTRYIKFNIDGNNLESLVRGIFWDIRLAEQKFHMLRFLQATLGHCSFGLALALVVVAPFALFRRSGKKLIFAGSALAGTAVSFVLNDFGD